VARRREDQVAGCLGLDPEAVDGAGGHVHERARAGADSRPVAEEVRDLALEDVEGLPVVLVAVQRNSFAALGLLVDERELPAGVISGGEEGGGRLAEPSELGLTGVIHKRLGRHRDPL
jgi:hypothetical protein